MTGTGRWRGFSFGSGVTRIAAQIAAGWLVVFLIALPAAVAQNKKDSPTRSVNGVVTTPDEKPVVGAVVQLKDTKTKQVRSFYTQQGGEYYFNGLSPDIEYELTATWKNEGTTLSSNTRTLSVFDSRKQAVINLKLNPKK